MIVGRVVTSNSPDVAVDSSLAYYAAGLIRNIGGTTVLYPSGAPNEIGDAAMAAKFSLTFAANDSTDSLQVGLTQAALSAGSIKVRWIATVDAVEVAN
jgi:hypothetical protein